MQQNHNWSVLLAKVKFNLGTKKRAGIQEDGKPK